MQVSQHVEKWERLTKRSKVSRPQRAFSITPQTFEHAPAEVDVSRVARVVFVGALDSSVYHTRHVCCLDFLLCVAALHH
jgi:hypothetical protein